MSFVVAFVIAAIGAMLIRIASVCADPSLLGGEAARSEVITSGREIGAYKPWRRRSATWSSTVITLVLGPTLYAALYGSAMPDRIWVVNLTVSVVGRRRRIYDLHLAATCFVGKGRFWRRRTSIG